MSLDWIHGGSPLGVLKKVRISQMKRSLLKYKHWTDYFCFSGVEQKDAGAAHIPSTPFQQYHTSFMREARRH